MTVITEVGEEGVLELALAFLGLIAASIVGGSEDLRGDYFE